MLINSVILFLRDALPVLLFISILCAILNRPGYSLSWLLPSATIGAVGVIILSANMAQISELNDGFGVELVTASIHLFIYLTLLLFLLQPGQTLQPGKSADKFKLQALILATIASSALISINGANLFIYFNGFWSDSGANNALLIGSILGFGISLSLSLLLYYGLSSSLINHWAKLPLIMLSFVGARQVTEATYFLIQADWLPTTQPIWNTSKWLSDSSEFGHLFNAFFGYEASPSVLQITLHLVALLIPLWLVFRIKTHSFYLMENPQ